jgi:hypothetical protein
MKQVLIVLVTAIMFITNEKAQAQGCVAIKGTSGVCGRPADAKGWELNLNNRYFRSYKHFVGTEEQKERVEKGTNVINNAYELDITATRTLNNRWSLGLTLPILSFNRSSMYEHDGKTRHNTNSFGIGDVRVSAYRWMFDPKKAHKANLQLGLGIKLPTGQYNAQDYFFKKEDSSIVGPVDQSIQPGDGGTGITFELNSYWNFTHKAGLYGSFFYLVNPKEVNGVSTARGSAPNATAKKYNTDVMSVPDLFMVRGGVSYMVKGFTFAGGVRIEGLPSKDLVGGSRGFRRPGYIISAEPSLTYVSKKVSYNLSVPVALKRNRTQSDSDKRRSADTKTHVQGDAAFADYLISAGITIKL